MKQVILDKVVIDHWELVSNKELFCELCGKQLIFKGIRKNIRFNLNTGLPKMLTVWYKCPKVWFEVESHHTVTEFTIHDSMLKKYNTQEEVDLIMLGQ